MEGEYLSIDTVKRIAELERELIEANESIIWWSNRYKSMQEINKIQAKKIIDYKLRKDKMKEYIENHIAIFKNGNILVDMNVEELLNILDGENNE